MLTRRSLLKALALLPFCPQSIKNLADESYQFSKTLYVAGPPVEATKWVRWEWFEEITSQVFENGIVRTTLSTRSCRTVTIEGHDFHLVKSQDGYWRQVMGHKSMRNNSGRVGLILALGFREDEIADNLSEALRYENGGFDGN